MTAICRFYQSGRCTYGNQCRYEHPVQTNVSAGGFNSTTASPSDYTVSADAIRLDMTKERPIWILSSYAPGKDPPVQLIDKKDFSPEELRVRAYELLAQGNFAQYETEASQLFAAAEAQINNIVHDIPGAKKFMEDAHLSKSRDRQPSLQTGTSSPFGAPTSPTTSAFQQPAPAFQVPSAFGQPVTSSTTPTIQPGLFGGNITKSAFGQPSVAPAFGQTATFGQPSLGQPSLGQPAFGQPAFGRPAFGQPAFGQPVTKPAASAFGQPAFGTPSTGFPASNLQPANAFGTSTSSPVTSAFGQPAQLSSPLNRAPFGTPQGPSNANNSFGTPAFGQPSSTASPFTTSNTATNAFGPPPQSAFQPSVTPTSTFAPSQPSQAPVSAFGPSVGGLSNENPFQTTQQTTQQLQQQQQQPQQMQQQLQQTQQPQQSQQQVGKWDDPPITYTQEELVAFAAPKFEIGKVPLVPPSSEMCR